MPSLAETLEELRTWSQDLANEDQNDLARLLGHAAYLIAFVRDEDNRRYHEVVNPKKLREVTDDNDKIRSTRVCI